MDNQNQQPLAHTEPASSEPVVAPVRAAVSQAQIEKPKLEISDETAQALLVVNGIQAGQRQKTKLPVTLIISIIIVILLAILSNALLGKVKTNGSTSASKSTNSSSASQSDTAPGSSVDNQINHDVNSCANPVNAVSDC
jgi:cytoskeletal protein RodZ